MDKTIKIVFEDTGDWWEIKRYLTVGIEREYREIIVDAQAIGDDTAKLHKVASAVDQMVVNSTVAWSYGSITLATLLAEIPSHHYDQIIERVHELYSPKVIEDLKRIVND